MTGRNESSLLASIVHDFRMSWRELAITDLVYKIVAFVLLTPLVGLLLRVLLAIRGESVVADQDIVYFFLGPVGWVSLILLGVAGIAIFALEQSALMAITWEASQDRRVPVWAALLFAAHHARPVLNVTVRMVALGLLVAAPFLAAGGAVYYALLTEFDINFYLAQKPPAFWAAGALLGCVLGALAVVLLGLVARLIFALPLLLFENIAPRDALRTSRQRSAGHSTRIVLWIVGWLLATTVLSATATGVVGLVGRLVVPLTTFSLKLLTATLGTVLLTWGIAHLVVTLITATTFAVLLANLYRKLGDPSDVGQVRLALPASAMKGTKFRLTRWRVLAGGVAAIVVSAAVGMIAVHGISLEDHTEIMAHRGASGAAPENTLASVERAIEDGADWVEIDVQESADGVVVVVHDRDLKRLAGVDLTVWEATAEQLRGVDVGSSFAPQFAGERIPTLEEVLQTCRGRVGLNIELKYYGHDQNLEQRVVELVEAADMQSDVVVMSLKRDLVSKVQSLRPDWTVGLLTAVAVGDLTTVDVDFLAVEVGLATRRFVRSAHRSGKEVYAWTVDDPVTMSAMMGRGVDSIITNEPALARLVLEQRAQLSPVERLLVELAALFGVGPQTHGTIDDV